MLELLTDKDIDLDIKSYPLTLKTIVENDMLFNIPLYQRLYVWRKEQIETLLGDLTHSFHTNSNVSFFLGGITIVKNGGTNDLIDGQQRFTTLWLISRYLKGDLEAFIYAKDLKDSPCRLSFAVREFANNYFNPGQGQHTFTEDEKKELAPITDAVDIIKTYFLSKDVDDFDLELFKTYLFEKVQIIATEMPTGIDENKVFEAMNNRGMQLQQHEILKSRLLKNITKEERGNYGLLWDACSIMDNYLEKNIKEVANLKWENLFPDFKQKDTTVEVPANILERLNAVSNDSEPVSITEILKQEKIIKVPSKEGGDYSAGVVRSIISFPMLLLHTLRIFQYRELTFLECEDAVEVKEKQLIAIFEKYYNEFDDEKTKKFIQLLWDVRVRFDKYVIKWVQNPNDINEEFHLIKKLYQSESSLTRNTPDTNEGFALLQSMLYHSQELITHYWLTPFLDKMLRTDNVDELHNYLKKLDNKMFCSPKSDLRTNSYLMMMIPEAELIGNVTFLSYLLDQPSGTGFASYWFYKLDYILWEARHSRNKSDSWQNYRMTAKNSVEHISPQNPLKHDDDIVYSIEDLEEVKKNKQNDFGNLVLLTSSLNSEYSNKLYSVKRLEYSKKKRLDSLKSDVIFAHEHWNYDLSQQHKREMINLYEQYLLQNNQ